MPQRKIVDRRGKCQGRAKQVGEEGGKAPRKWRTEYSVAKIQWNGARRHKGTQRFESSPEKVVVLPGIAWWSNQFSQEGPVVAAGDNRQCRVA